jgi:hypothetical protein
MMLEQARHYYPRGCVSHSRLVASALAVCCLTFDATTVRSQAFALKPIHVGIAAGATLPVGDFNTPLHFGWNLGVLMSISTRFAPLSFRFDGQWQRMTGDFANSQLDSVSNLAHLRVIDGTANAVYTIGFLHPPTKIYLIGGAGVYFGQAKSVNSPHTENITRFGLNGGAGMKIEDHGPATFLELRYHYVFHGTELRNDAAAGGTMPLKLYLLTLGFIF